MKKNFKKNIIEIKNDFFFFKDFFYCDLLSLKHRGKKVERSANSWLGLN